VVSQGEAGGDSRTAARILVADDNADMREYLTRLLSQRWTVEAVSDGSVALAAARRSSFDLVLADVMMPGIDGISLVKQLRADPKLGQLPIILLSARSGEESRIEGLHTGADDYLIKPFSARELIARVQARLDIVRLRMAAGSAPQDEARRKDEFLNLLAHELRNPLAAISTAVQLLTDSMTDEERVSLNAMMDRQVGLMRRLPDDLLDLGRITRGFMQLKKALIDLAKFLQDVTEVSRFEEDYCSLTERQHHLLRFAAIAFGPLRLVARPSGDWRPE